jgi:hypothetical protein
MISQLVVGWLPVSPMSGDEWTSAYLDALGELEATWLVRAADPGTWEAHLWIAPYMASHHGHVRDQGLLGKKLARLTALESSLIAFAACAPSSPRLGQPAVRELLMEQEMGVSAGASCERTINPLELRDFIVSQVQSVAQRHEAAGSRLMRATASEETAQLRRLRRPESL